MALEPNLNDAIPDAPEWASDVLGTPPVASGSGEDLPIAGRNVAHLFSATEDREPPVSLDPFQDAMVRGEHPVLKADGKVDRSATLNRIGGFLAKAGTTAEQGVAWLQYIDHAKGFHKYCERKDSGAHAYLTIMQTQNQRLRGGATPPPVPTAPRLISAPELARLSSEVAPALVHGLLGPGLAVLAGSPKAGKSWLSLQIALAVATGTSLFGRVVRERRIVVYIALEDGELRLKFRLKRLYVPLSETNAVLPPETLFFCCRWPRLDQVGIAQLTALLDERGDVGLVIIDTWGRARPRAGRGNAYDEDTEALAPLQQLALARGITILLVHHTRKTVADDPFEMVSGSTGITGVADQILLLRRTRGKPSGSLLIAGRDIEDQEIPLTFDDTVPWWKLAGAEEQERLSDERQEVFQVLLEDGGRMSAQAVADVLDKPRGTVKRLLWELKKLHCVESSGSGYIIAAPFAPAADGSTGSGGSGGSAIFADESADVAPEMDEAEVAATMTEMFGSVDAKWGSLRDGEPAEPAEPAILDVEELLFGDAEVRRCRLRQVTADWTGD